MGTNNKHKQSNNSKAAQVAGSSSSQASDKVKAPQKAKHVAHKGTALILNKTDLVISTATRVGLSKALVKKSLDAILDTISNTLTTGGEVRILGFGSFIARNINAREGRHPRTQAPIKIAAHKRAAFRAGKEIKTTLKPA